MSSALQEALFFIVETIASMFLILVLLRFLFQLTRADFYNPISQAIFKITNPVLLPIRKVIPGFFGVDIACIVLALLVQFIFGQLIALIFGGTFVHPLALLMWGFAGIVMYIANIFLVAILILVVASFIAPMSNHPALMLVNQLTAPLLAPIRKVLPPAGGLDFSVMALAMAIYVIRILLSGVAQSIGAVGSNAIFVLGF